MAAASGCADQSSGQQCGADQKFNQLEGKCVAVDRCGPDRQYNELTGQCIRIDAGPGADVDPPADTGSPHEQDAARTDSSPPNNPDTGDSQCHGWIDSDDDGLDDLCECEYGLDPNDSDTDGDGIPDGEELQGDCTFDPGEGDTNPQAADTDQDGLDDKEELEAGTDPLHHDTDGDGIKDGIEASSCTDPLKKDTDGDGIEDGTEDANHDGKLGTCPNREYDPSCAGIESDPCKVDTDGDGTTDDNELQFRRCRASDTSNLTRPLMIESQSGNYKLAAEPGITKSKVSLKNGSIDAHVFADSAHDYTGFVLNYSADNRTDPTVLAGDIASSVQSLYTKPNSSNSYAVRRSTGRQSTTHDGHQSVVNAVLDIPNYSDSGQSIPAPEPHIARDDILAELVDASPADLNHSLSSQFQASSSEPTLFVYQVVSRSPSEAIVVGALTTLPSYQDLGAETGYRVDDVTGGTALAEFSETLKPDCVSFQVESTPKVDFIISLDASGSMSDEQDQLSNFAQTFTDLLDRANLDWRVGVTGVACSEIQTDSALPAAYRGMWPPSQSGQFPPTPGPCNSLNLDPGYSGPTNGQLAGGSFTTEASTLSRRLDNLETANAEYTLSMGVAAAARALPPKPNSPSRIRPDASVITIAVTDEMEELFSYSFQSFGNKKDLSGSEIDQVETTAGPWVDYLDRKEMTAFGLYAPPGESCQSAQQYAHGIAEIVDKSGGSGGSVCQNDVANTLRSIANAASGIASSIRLLGSPVAPSLEVKHVDLTANSGNDSLVEMERSRSDGFAYDAIVNRISFHGQNPPETGDRLIIPYLRWKDSIKRCEKEKDPCPNDQVCVSGFCR